MKRQFIFGLLALICGYSNAQNPLINNQFTADPTARVFNGKVYLYPSHDIISPVEPEKKWFCMADYHVFSSSDLSSWRDHGVILSQENVPWGDPKAYSMWAPDCVERNGKYYFYFPDAIKDEKGFRIGVAVADRPEGPFKAMDKFIDGVLGIDPCVLQTSKGEQYIYWSAGRILCAKLKDNMCEIEGEPIVVSEFTPKKLKEGPFVFERDNKFYLTYPWVRKENGTEALVYEMSDSPTGPFEYKGVIMEEHANKCWTNHHSIVNYRGQWYIFYHHNDYSPDFDKNRSACADSLFFGDDGSIQLVKPTLRGVGTVRGDAVIQVDRYSASSPDVKIAFNDPKKPFDGWYITLPKKGSFSTFNNVDFGFYAPKSLKVRARFPKGKGELAIMVNNVVLNVNAPKNDAGKPDTQWNEFTLSIDKDFAGKQDLRFESVDGTVDIDFVQFKKFHAVDPPEGKSSENNIPGAIYPCVDEQHRATFSLFAPSANEVAVDICSKVFPMKRDENGNWKVTTTPLPIGHHYYRLKVDGVNVNDPNVYTIYGAGSCFSQIEIPESADEADYYTFHKDIPHGQVRECQYWSNIHNKMRRCYVYTPAGYDNSSQKYPYFILNHGMAENETGWHTQGKMANIMDNNIAAGKAVPMIVVMDNGDCDYGFGTVPGETRDEFGASFEGVVLNEIIPFVESNFRVYNDRDHRGIAGLSWGGHQAFEIGLNHTDKFSNIGAFSGAIFVFPGMELKNLWGGVFTDAEKFNKDVHFLFMSNGTEEGLGAMSLDPMLDKAGIKYTRYVSQGTAHEWLTWRRSLNQFIQKAFK